MSNNTDQEKIDDILKKIDREKKLATGATNLRKKTSNASVIQKCNTQVRDAQKNIEYLESTLRRLSINKNNLSSSLNKSSENDDTYSNNNSNNNNNNNNLNKVSTVQAPSFTALDLLKYDCPSLGHKIQYMMQLLEFKIQVEEQYREANQKMYNLYQVDGDRSSVAMAEGGRLDSDRRLQIMKRSLKEYQSMYIDFDDVARENAVINTFRKNPLSGILSISIDQVRNIDHMTSPAFTRNPECIVSIKIDDNEKARTKGSRNDRWADYFDIKVEKANELSITIYDKIDDQLIPVGLAWLPLSDVAEEIRRKRVSQERGNSNNWISASKLKQADGSITKDSEVPHATQEEIISTSGPSTSSSAATGTASTTTISQGPIRSSCWFGVEPSGEILITLGFVKTSGDHNKRSDNNAFSGGLGRHGAIRQRKEEVIESQGHKFVQKQFYNIMCCAVCGDFLRYTGYQCEDCRYLCHKGCIKNVIAKCISKSSADLDSNETKLNHRIPHRFIQVTNRGTKWCCHCGYILPWGRKNVRKCSDCGIMCHAGCAHLVPDLCGMPVKTANQILEAIKATQQQKTQKDLRKKKRLQEKPSNGSTLINTINMESPHSGKITELPTKKEKKPPSAPTPSQVEQKSPKKLQTQKEYPHEAVSRNSLERLRDEKLNISPQKKLRGKSSSELLKSTADNEGMVTAPASPCKSVSQNVSPFKPSSQNASPLKQTSENASSLKQTSQNASPSKRTSQNSSPTKLDKNFSVQEHDTTNLMKLKTNESVDLGQSIAPPASIHPPHQHSHHHHHRNETKRRHRHRYGLDDFRFLSVLGKGNFGKVMLAESVHTDKLCAIKVLKKDFIIQNDEVESTKSEKRVFLIANKNQHPFLLNLYQCFQTENRIYFVMEYISGGDLMWHVQQKRFSLRRAKFYAAEVLLALKFLHENGVVYRDLKLDNILLTTDGHIKLADYGLCKENMFFGNKTNTFCGTPELMAPEILKDQGYDKAVDWWAFGVLLYQMILTKTPFKGEDEDEVFNAILTDEPLYPITMAREAVDILQKLLTRDPTKRLGYGEKDALEIMEHPYFEDINFEEILNCSIKPPYVPEIKDPRDAKCFEEEFTSQAAKLTPVNSVLSPSVQEMFRGFTYTCEETVL